LDFFAGSGTTGHAVMQQNAEDGGRRRYILVQLPEPTPEGSEARRQGFRTIADITRERLRRAADRIAQSQANELPLDGAAPPLDLGFRAFYLDRSNLRVWHGAAPQDGEAHLAQQLELHLDHVADDASDEALVYELIFRYGFPLTVDIKRLTLAGVEVFSVESTAEGQGGLIVCTATEGLTIEALEAMANLEPVYTFVRERAFGGNDHLLTNGLKTFAKKAREVGHPMFLWTV
jgi:adenine-specific DNA-methyltransferase